jgi:hypothetical protein
MTAPYNLYRIIPDSTYRVWYYINYPAIGLLRCLTGFNDYKFTMKWPSPGWGSVSNPFFVLKLETNLQVQMNSSGDLFS